jgi:hypothetical protein
MTLPLFSDDPAPAITGLVLTSTEAPLSKEQKAFNNLVAKLDKARRKLAGWRETLVVFQRRCAGELLPRETRLAELQAGLARALHAAHGQKGVTAAERRKLSMLIVELAAGVLQARDDAEMKALYNEHGGTDYDAETEAADAELKAMLAGIFGVELGGDVDMRSPEAVAAELEAQMRARAEAAGEDDDGAPASAPPRRPSARQQAREARQAAEEKAMSQTVRDVYRKLASALHPDRIGADVTPAERADRTALMQRANSAYEANNLLRLLELQIEIEQIDSAHLAGLAPERLKRYQQILRAQLQDLVEINGIEYDLRQQLNLRGRITPKALLQHVDADVAALDGEIRRLDGELALSADLKALKAWLKIRPPAGGGVGRVCVLRLVERSAGDYPEPG